MLGAGLGGHYEEEQGPATSQSSAHVTDEENPLVLHSWVETCGTYFGIS